MNVRNAKLGRFLGLGALTFALLGAASCGEGDGSGGGLLGGLAEQCGFKCASAGIVEGNASISGLPSVDGFFQSVVNFRGVANTVAADIKAELDGIQAAFGISPDELKKAGSLSAAVKAKIGVMAKLTVKAQPPKCEIDAKLTLEAQAKCEVQAKCDVKPGELAVQCMGTCEVDVNASGGCDGSAELTCEVSAPEFACKGECSGTCSVTGELAAKCSGKCDGTCSVALDEAGNCNGACSGSCALTGEAALNCDGKCNGSCTYKPGTAKCDANAQVHCDFKASAKAECKGKCTGEFEPPKVDCDASASCEASAKADAKFQAKCTPPSVDIRLNVMATAQLDFAIADLRVRLPRLLAALKKAKLVVTAGEELVADGSAAVDAAAKALGEAEVKLDVQYRLLSCVPAQLAASAEAIQASSKELGAQVSAAGELTTMLGVK
jgi:hypothetical protein